ncbi:MAG: transposase [Saprospirales bacterium]|nr:transposase [Saprospirales bacterium]
MAKVQAKASKKQEVKQKDKYRVTNWSSYNQSLVKRGDITIWFDEALREGWYYEGPDQRGAQYEYSDGCMTGLLQLKAVFDLKYRQLEGFTKSLVKLMSLDLKVPSYSQINRRAQQMKVEISAPNQVGRCF